MVTALIEARSCERFKLLGEMTEDEEIGKLYKALYSSYLGHCKVFLKLALKVEKKAVVERRWLQMLAAEAKILERQEPGPRMHSGLAPVARPETTICGRKMELTDFRVFARLRHWRVRYRYAEGLNPGTQPRGGRMVHVLHRGCPVKRFRPSNRNIEEHYFEMFRKVYPLPIGIVGYGDKPDVTIDGLSKLGIEITNFYLADGSSPASEQVQQRRRIESVSQAQQIHEREGGANFQLSFSFNKDTPILDVPGLVAKLLILARRVEGRANGSIEKCVFEDIPELEFVHLHARELVYPSYDDPEFPNGPPNESEGFTAWAKYQSRRRAHAIRAGIYAPLSFTATWNVGQGHDVGLMCSKRLTEIVAEKENKASGYAPCDAYWLLVVVDSMNPAQEQEIRLDDGLNISSKIFQKVIVYKATPRTHC